MFQSQPYQVVFLRKYIIPLLWNKLYKLCLWIAVSVNLVGVLITLGILIDKFDGAFSIQYTPQLIIVVFAIIAAFSIILKTKDIKARVDDINCILDTTDFQPDIIPDLNRQARITEIHMVINLLFTMATHYAYFKMDAEEFCQDILIYRYLAESFPMYPVLPNLYLVTFSICSTAIFAGTVLSLYIYTTGHHYFQHIERLVTELEYLPHCDYQQFLLVRRNYQLNTYRNLVRFHLMHDNLFWFIKRTCDNIYYITIAYTICGILMMPSIVLVLLRETISMKTAVRLICLGLTAGHTASLYFWYGQNLESKSDVLLPRMSSTPWYYWNSTNQKTLLFILMKVSTPVTFQASSAFVINYRLALQYIKFTFSFIAMLSSTGTSLLPPDS